MKKILLLVLVVMFLVPVVIVAADNTPKNEAKIELVKPGETATPPAQTAAPGPIRRSPWGIRDPFGGDPFAMMRQLHDDMDRMFEDSFGSTDPFAGGMQALTPGRHSLWTGMAADFRVDMKEEGENLVVTCELPGMDKSRMKVRIHENRLLISGERSQDTKTQGDNYYRREIRSGSVSRALQLPVAVDEASASAAYRDGVLTVTVKKKGKLPEPGREITIE